MVVDRFPSAAQLKTVETLTLVCLEICRQLQIVHKLCISLSYIFYRCLSKMALYVILITEELFHIFERLLYLYDSVSAKSNISGKYPNNNFIILHGVHDFGPDIQQRFFVSSLHAILHHIQHGRGDMRMCKMNQ